MATDRWLGYDHRLKRALPLILVLFACAESDAPNPPPIGDIGRSTFPYADAAEHYRMALAVDAPDAAVQRKVLVALMEAGGDGDDVRAFLDELPPEEDDRWRGRVRRTYASGDANFRIDSAFSYTFSDPGEWVGWSIGAMGRVAEPSASSRCRSGGPFSTGSCSPSRPGRSWSSTIRSRLTTTTRTTASCGC